jgi:hypothetical protein
MSSTLPLQSLSCPSHFSAAAASSGGAASALALLAPRHPCQPDGTPAGASSNGPCACQSSEAAGRAGSRAGRRGVERLREACLRGRGGQVDRGARVDGVPAPPGGERAQDSRAVLLPQPAVLRRAASAVLAGGHVHRRGARVSALEIEVGALWVGYGNLVA